MEEVVYRFIKTQPRAMQNALFDALAYQSAYGELPKGLTNKQESILALVVGYEQLAEANKGKQPSRRKRTYDVAGEVPMYPADEATTEADSSNRNASAPAKEETAPVAEDADATTETVEVEKKKHKSFISTELLSDVGIFRIKFPFVDELLAPAFIKWVTYKKERGQTYKSMTSLRTCYKQLLDYSGGDADVAEKVVDRSIANNWAGLFELDKRKNYGSYQQQREDRNDKWRNEAANAIQELLDERGSAGS